MLGLVGGCQQSDSLTGYLGELEQIQPSPPILAPEGSLLREPLQPLPARLSEVGLYLALPEREQVPDVALPYEPVWPLWSSGSDKQRFVVLPEGEVIDNRVVPWVLPVGTLLFKTFTYDDWPVETRLMRQIAIGEWEYEVYAWADDGLDATLVDITLPVPVDAPIGTHTIPARLDCRSCHESSDSAVLGVSELQLAPMLDALDEQGALAIAPPAIPATIEHEDDTTRRILGWLHADCVHCHNGSDGPSSSYDLRADVALTNLVGAESDSSGSAGGIRVIPGDPEGSLLFRAISGQGDDAEVKVMPPFGVDARDEVSIALVRQWIEGLE
ncbi:MAG: c-type cytochrome domain-containing protein [Myxococcota bacterium]